MVKAKIYNSQEKCMDGAELYRLRNAAEMSREVLAMRMEPFGWYKCRVQRLEDAGRFCLAPVEMERLLAVLGASSV